MNAAGGQRVRRVARRLLLAVLIGAAAGGVLWFRGLERREAPEAPSAGTAPPTGAEMVTRNFRHAETRLDRTIWVLEAAEAVVRGEQAQLTAVKITWYGEPGAVPVVITSDAGRIDFRNRSALLTGGVRMARADGAVLETERLSYDEGRKLVQAPSAVLITTPTFTFRGTGLSADVERRVVRLDGRVEGEIRGAITSPAGNS
jgi:LPS export ABC transporter protein LptC